MTCAGNFDLILLCAKRAEVDFGVARITFRNSVEKIQGKNVKCLVREKICVDDKAQRMGIYKNLTEYMERIARNTGRGFMVENVLSPKLSDYLEQHGYRSMPGSIPNLPNVRSYYKYATRRYGQAAQE